MRKAFYCLLTVIFSFTFLFSNAQVSTKEQKKLEKAERKRQKEAKEFEDWKAAKKLIQSRQFVFSGDQVFIAGRLMDIDPGVNFLANKGEDAVFQCSLFGNLGIPNPNRLGGVQTNSAVTRFKYSADKERKPIDIEITLKPKAAQGFGVYQNVVNVSLDNHVELILPRRFQRLKGKIASLEIADVFEGATF